VRECFFDYDPVWRKLALGLLAVTAARAVNGSIGRVVECAFALLDLRLAIRFGTVCRIPDGDPWDRT
jgi:hypothetical protein